MLVVQLVDDLDSTSRFSRSSRASVVDLTVFAFRAWGDLVSAGWTISMIDCDAHDLVRIEGATRHHCSRRIVATFEIGAIESASHFIAETSFLLVDCKCH